LLAHERPGHSFATTDLVHEAAAKLMGSDKWTWENRQHFFGVAATAMRRILVDHARAANADKRGGGRQRVDLDTGLGAGGIAPEQEDLLGIDEELNKLAAINERAARIVELRFFGGFKMSEVAEAIGVAESVAYGDWAYARAWLYRRLGPVAADGRTL